MRVSANFYVPNLRYHYKHKKISSCVLSDISNLAHRNSSKLVQIIRLIAILLSGELQENRLLGSTYICFGTKYCTLVQFGTESPTL